MIIVPKYVEPVILAPIRLDMLVGLINPIATHERIEPATLVKWLIVCCHSVNVTEDIP
jgi:hypothetical protein